MPRADIKNVKTTLESKREKQITETIQIEWIGFSKASHFNFIMISDEKRTRIKGKLVMRFVNPIFLVYRFHDVEVLVHFELCLKKKP